MLKMARCLGKGPLGDQQADCCTNLTVWFLEVVSVFSS